MFYIVFYNMFWQCLFFDSTSRRHISFIDLFLGDGKLKSVYFKYTSCLDWSLSPGKFTSETIDSVFNENVRY